MSEFNAFKMAQAQFYKVAEMLNLSSSVCDLLSSPLYEHTALLSVKMDDGTIKIFRGFRIQHNNARGAFKGGVRFHPLETLDTIRALSMWMTWKCSVVDLPLGGSQGGVICDPHNLSLREQENLCREFVRKFKNVLGPHYDVPSPDVMALSQHMTWMLDEYETLCGVKTPGFITGKPVGLGGSLGRAEATGYGLVFILREALRELCLKPQNTRMAVQGFGTVARHAAVLYSQLGGKITCVSTWDQKEQTAYAFVKKDGININELLSISDRFGGIDRFKAKAYNYEVLPGEEWLKQEVEILLPAALENQITAQNVGEISPTVKIIIEGANGPVTPEADLRIIEHGIFLIPDFLANAGGVTCSYFEQVQSNLNYYWDKDEVLGKLDVRMTQSFLEVAKLAMTKHLYMRDAAYVIAINKVVEAVKLRGWV